MKLFLFELLSFGLQLTGETVGEVKAVANMHQRKAEMAKRSDAFIALPGSYNNTFMHASTIISS